MTNHTASKIAVWTLLLLLLSTADVDSGRLCAQVEESTNTATKSGTDAEASSVAAVVDGIKDSVLIVRQMDSNGVSRSIGSGFVIDATKGLIATNYHVIGDAKPLRIETKSGNKHSVVAIHASDQQMDLAIVKVDGKLPDALILADTKLKQGDSVIAIGHPGGLKHSVVEGLVSARQVIDGKPMLQLSLPIEQGNSGGPVLDRNGDVHAVLSLKSLQAENTGFAIEVSVLKRMLANANPITFERWLTIGDLDEKFWRPVFDARWKQRVDKILVDGAGRGFGGRSLCLRGKTIDSRPIELSVEVRMDDESGAAGLAFHSDGKHRHYGFYPSNGRVRLTRFDGPDVYSWNVLQEVETGAYRPGEWNALRVVMTDGELKCFVNDVLVVTSTDKRYKTGRAGLAKFRQTKAEYRNFRVSELKQPGATALAKLSAWAPDSESSPLDSDVEVLADDPGTTVRILEEQARRLEKQAQAIRKVGRQIGTRRVQQQLMKELDQPEPKINLLRATLLLSKLDNPKLDIAVYEREVERMAEQIDGRLQDDSSTDTRIEVLNTYLFKENGFHGNRFEYYSQANINDVIYNRQGLPITVSVLYIELASRLGLNVVGIGLPGHFVVRVEPTASKTNEDSKSDQPTDEVVLEPKDGRLIDPFEGGITVSRDDAERRVRAVVTDESEVESFFVAQTKSQIIQRMLRNVVGMAERSRDEPALLRYMETLVRLYPDEVEFRAKRVDLRVRAGNLDGAIADIDWFLDANPEGVEIERLREYRSMLQRRK